MSRGGTTVIAAGTALLRVDVEALQVSTKMIRGKALISHSDIRSDEKLVVMAEEQGSIACGIIEQHTLLRRFFGLKSSATVAKFTPDGYSVIGGNKAGQLILWDLAMGQAQFGVQLFKEQVTDVAFVGEGLAAVSSGDGTIAFVDYRSTTIEKGVSEASPRQAVGDYLAFRWSLAGAHKINQLLYLQETGQLLALCGDHIQLLDVDMSLKKLEQRSKSAQIVKGITHMNAFLDAEGQLGVVAGCLDGTIRRFSG